MIKRLRALFKSTGSVTIDGKSFRGRHVEIIDDLVIVNGVTQEGSLVGPISVTVHGDVEHLTTASGDVTVTGDCHDVTTTSGDVRCGDVAGEVRTVSGDVTCKQISGNVRTVSGDVRL